MGKDHIITANQTAVFKKYWYSKFPLESLTELEELVETSMTKENFSKVNQPTLLLYYYKNEKEQDNVVSVAAMKDMFEQLGTSANMKKQVVIPNAGDHVIGGAIISKDIQAVEKETEQFAIEILKLNLKNQ
jgi:hypothetical protein